mmetsp:Transcript_23289/g.54902  ORF Transcript_23289/g.54902 Transcript_23289/m.54902 type:complete len:461 (+) Transcript_23289:330-1712(+)
MLVPTKTKSIWVLDFLYSRPDFPTVSLSQDFHFQRRSRWIFFLGAPRQPDCVVVRVRYDITAKHEFLLLFAIAEMFEGIDVTQRIRSLGLRGCLSRLLDVFPLDPQQVPHGTPKDLQELRAQHKGVVAGKEFGDEFQHPAESQKGIRRHDECRQGESVSKPRSETNVVARIDSARAHGGFGVPLHGFIHDSQRGRHSRSTGGLGYPVRILHHSPIHDNVPIQRIRCIDGQEGHQYPIQEGRVVSFRKGLEVGRQDQGVHAGAVLEGIHQVLVSLRIPLQLADPVHDQALSRPDQIGECRAKRGNHNVVGRRRHRIGIVRRLVGQHPPIEKHLGQRAHGIGVKDVDKGNAAGNLVGTKQVDAGTPRMQEGPGPLDDNHKGSSEPFVLPNGKENVEHHRAVEKGNCSDRVPVQVIHPVVCGKVQDEEEYNAKEDQLVPQNRGTDVSLRERVRRRGRSRLGKL